MKNLVASVVVCLAALAAPGKSRGEEYVIFKASASLPVSYVIEGQSGANDKSVTKMLTSKEIINLSLGRAIDFKPADPKSEVLALAVAYEDDGQMTYSPNVTVATPKTVLILWNPLAPVLANRWVQTIASVTELEYDRTYVGSGIKGQGIATATIPAGAVPENKFFATTLRGVGKVAQATFPGSAQPPAQPGAIKTFAFSVTGMSGRVKLNFTDKNNPAPGVAIVGMVVKGALSTSGAPLDLSFNH